MNRTRFACTMLLAATLGLGACDGSPSGPGPEPDPDPAPTPPMGVWVTVSNVPVAGWSAALLPTGKVLLFQNGEGMRLWDPESRQFGGPFNSNTNLFCAGLALLSDGRLLAAGGHAGQDEGENFLGLNTAEIFDPWQEQWTRLPDMAGGERWYPTAVTLPDGRVLVASGTHAGALNESIELFDPAQESWEIVANQELPLYPWAAVLANGELLFYGPQRTAGLFDPNTGAFRPAGTMSRARFNGAGVLLNAGTGELLALGGGGPPMRSAEIFDAATETWRPIPPMAEPRQHLDAVLLPDGTVLAVGGRSTAEEEEGEPNPEGDVRMAEALDPETGRWSEAGYANYGHGYHSSALLLPDGSVLAAGPQRNLELNLPWYFFAGARPVVESLPATAGYGETLSVTVSTEDPIGRVVLIRTSSATHSLNTDQRYLELEFQQASGGELAVQAPASPALAPPGYYLLFVVTDDDLPSEGRFVQLR